MQNADVDADKNVTLTLTLTQTVTTTDLQIRILPEAVIECFPMFITCTLALSEIVCLCVCSVLSVLFTWTALR